PLARKVDVEAKDELLSSVLQRTLYPIALGYKLLDENVIAIMKEGSSAAPPTIYADTIRSVRGQVIDADGKPLVNATISIRRTGKGTATDEFGTFTLNASLGDTLQVSMVGLIGQNLRITSFKVLTITLQASTDKLNEVVVVGYGKQKKITVTGSVASVNMMDMRTPVANLSNALAGKVAGVISVQSSGEPGYDNSMFTIRGVGTFTGNSSPLIIVDGVQRDDVNSTYGGAFNNIDPEDIASISLLKDASSTAMYGAKGANGVLIITTKRGVAGKAKISLKSETGMTGFTKTPKMLDGISYMKLLNEAEVNMGNPAKYSDELIQKTASGLDPYLYPNVDWMNTVYRKNSSLTNANLNVSGGSESVRYFLSASFYNQDGPYKVSNLNGYNPNLNYKRYDFRSNVDVNITKTTLLQLNLGAMLVNARYPGISAAHIWYLSYATTPVGFPIRYPDGKWSGPVNNGGNNPLNEVQNNGYSTEFKPSVQSVFTLTQKLDFLTKGLEAYGRFSFDSYGEFDNKRIGLNDLWHASGRDENGQLVFGNPVRVGQQFLDYSRDATGERIMYLEGNINYNKSLGEHHIGVMALYNMRNRLVSTAQDAIRSIPFRNQAMAGRLTYSYNDKYLAEVNAGYTGSENFEKGKKFGFFPAVSAGWVISREGFFDGLANTVTLLKIRGSYGVVGNDQIGDPTQVNRFPYLTQIGGGNSTGFGLSGYYYGGQTENVIGVQNLTWEKSHKTDLGLEIGIVNKFSLIVDYFNDKRKNILIQRSTVSSIAGYSGSKIFANLGEMNNYGLDASVEYNDRFGKTGLRLYGNVTYSRNKIVFQDEPNRKYAYQRGTGHRYGDFTAYVSDGLFTDQNDIDNSPVQKFELYMHPGDVKYKNLNPKDDNVIDTYDWNYTGKSWFPSWLYGAGFTVDYHHFDLSMFFQGTLDAGIMANGSWFDGSGWGAGGVGVIPFSGIGQYPNNTLANVADRWTAANPREDAYYPRLTLGSLSDNNYQSSTRWLKNGAYLRFKQASLGYTLSSETLKKAGLSTLYFYLSGQNLLTFSKFKLWDPELGSNGAKYPITRMVTCGIRAQF
ncbi:SusC/RagA family TonB-linked outer membrane protein, partial [Flavitalea flava]